MTYTLMIALASAAAGSGIWLALRGALGPPATLQAFVDELHRPRGTTPAATTPADRLLGSLFATSADRHRHDLDVCERSATKFALDRLIWTMFGAAPGLVFMLIAVAGYPLIPAPITIVGAVIGAIGGWFWSIIDLRADAAKRRREIRHALATYLELVSILMSGGAGVESALYSAATIGRGVGFRHFQSALMSARARREPPWDTLGELGRRLNVTDLVELRSSMTLAGGGARVSDSLRAKAASMRSRDQADQESHAEARSESMALPVVLMFAGFLILIGYPAMAGLMAT